MSGLGGGFELAVVLLLTISVSFFLSPLISYVEQLEKVF